MANEGRKQCTLCGEAKGLGDYHRDRAAADGRQKRCKECAKRVAREWYAENKERATAAAKARYDADPAPFKERATRHRRENRPKHNERSRIARRLNPLKTEARALLNRAVAEGKLVKPPACEQCGVTPPRHLLQGHHKDYMRPLDVRWLCVDCHAAVHRE